jgi:3-phytase
MKITFTMLCGVLCCGAFAVAPAVAAGSAPDGQRVVKSADSLALPQGHRLAIEKRRLRLLDAAGGERATLAVRAEHADVRPTEGGARVALLDADAQRPLLIDVDLAAGVLQATPGPQPAMAIEALCLYRDGQRLDHLLLIGKDGQAEQWLLSGAEPRLFRRLALPPGVEHCRVDDASGRLRVDEPAVGRWIYDIGGEGIPGRALLGRRGAERMPAAVATVLPLVAARAQTEPVARRGDAADDPALWVHPRDPERSRVLATNKKQGLLSYDLQGRQRQLIEAGRLNNVDVRQRVRLAGRQFDLAVATQRDEKALAIFEIDADGNVRDAGRIVTELRDIYGTCLYRPADGGLEAFVNDKDGRFAHYRIEFVDGAFAGRLLRRFAVASQPEGCVADDRAGRLFFGEEDRGIWTMAAADGAPGRPQLILPVGPRLVADVEGLALYLGERGRYLVASSQGNNSYVVLDAAPPFAWRGAFRIGIDVAAGIDGVSETDGLEVTAANLGGPYDQGLLVVQDGYKRLPDGPQNFKFVAWRDIARALRLE